MCLDATHGGTNTLNQIHWTVKIPGWISFSPFGTLKWLWRGKKYFAACLLMDFYVTDQFVKKPSWVVKRSWSWNVYNEFNGFHELIYEKLACPSIGNNHWLISRDSESRQHIPETLWWLFSAAFLSVILIAMMAILLMYEHEYDVKYFHIRLIRNIFFSIWDFLF